MVQFHPIVFSFFVYKTLPSFKQLNICSSTLSPPSMCNSSSPSSSLLKTMVLVIMTKLLNQCPHLLPGLLSFLYTNSDHIHVTDIFVLILFLPWNACYCCVMLFFVQCWLTAYFVYCILLFLNDLYFVHTILSLGLSRYNTHYFFTCFKLFM